MKNQNKVYDIITESVIKGLQTKGAKWFKPWSNGNEFPPMSYGSKKPYTGINYWLLSDAMAEFGYKSPLFITWKQIEQAGGKLNKEHNSHQVYYWNVSYSTKNDNGERTFYNSLKALQKAGLNPGMPHVQTHFSPRYYTVFNLDQTTGIKDFTDKQKEKVVEGTIFEPIPVADDVWNGYRNKPSLKHGGITAYYKPAKHHIQMPIQNDFVSSDDYYKVLFHEVIHSTGHESILNRFKENKNEYSSSKKEYSFEELVAELGAMFLVGVTGLKPECDESNSQAYINGWIEHLKSNPKEILYASVKSQKAIEYILNTK